MEIKKSKIERQIEQVRSYLAEDDWDIEGYARIALNIASKTNGNFEIYNISEEICGNDRVEDAYGTDSGWYDLWIDVKGFDEYAGFYIVGVYLTDLWNYGSDNADEIREHMFIREFKEDRSRYE